MSVETVMTLLARRCRERADEARAQGRARAADRLATLATCFERESANPAAHALDRRLADVRAGRFPDGRFWEPAEAGELTDCESALSYLSRL